MGRANLTIIEITIHGTHLGIHLVVRAIQSSYWSVIVSRKPSLDAASILQQCLLSCTGVG